MSDPIDLNAPQHQFQHLAAEVVLFLLGSRYCETYRLSDEAAPVRSARTILKCEGISTVAIFANTTPRLSRPLLA